MIYCLKKYQSLAEKKSTIREEINRMTVKSSLKEVSEGEEEDRPSKAFEKKRSGILQKKEREKKGDGICSQLKHIFSRGTIFLLILNYGLLFGSFTAQGAVCAEVYASFGIKQVTFFKKNF